MHDVCVNFASTVEPTNVTCATYTSAWLNTKICLPPLANIIRINTLLSPNDLDKQFSVLKKCNKKFDCLVHEMLLIRKLTICVTLHISYMLLIIQKNFCQFISNHFDLENSVKMTPKRRSFLYTLFFTCFSFI